MAGAKLLLILHRVPPVNRDQVKALLPTQVVWHSLALIGHLDNSGATYRSSALSGFWRVHVLIVFIKQHTIRIFIWTLTFHTTVQIRGCSYQVSWVIIDAAKIDSWSFVLFLVWPTHGLVRSRWVVSPVTVWFLSILTLTMSTKLLAQDCPNHLTQMLPRIPHFQLCCWKMAAFLSGFWCS